MLKFFNLKPISTIAISILLVSCGNKKENFDIDLSTFKIPQKTSIEIPQSENSDSSETKTLDFDNKLSPYKKKSEILNSVKIGKKDPFSQQSEVSKLSSVIKLTGFLDSGKEKYVFVVYQNNEGTINEESIGGVNTNLLPIGAKVIDIDTQKMQLTIKLDSKDYIFQL